MRKYKLSINQIKAIETLKKYPNEMIMKLKDGYWLTGGHGIKFDRRTIDSLTYKHKIIDASGKLTNINI